MKMYSKCRIHGLLFEKDTIKAGKYRRCKICAKRLKKLFREKNLISERRKSAINAKKWKKNNPEKFKKRHYEWMKENREKVRSSNNKSFKKSIENLGDRYIRCLIKKRSSLKSSDINSGILEAKRSLVKLKRKIKELQNVNK